jgi:formate hydrogenlyase transcriptional activator
MLLRVLQEREFERLGGNQTVSVDVRIVAASNCDLAELVKSGKFRSDLYYRLNVFPIHMPPLRERPEDIPLLAGHFAGKYAERFGRKITRIDARTLTALRSYNWPGNVRELENEVERAVILAQSSTLRITWDRAPGSHVGGSLTEQLHSSERQTIEGALRATGGRIAGANGAARRLGLAPSTLEFRIKRLGIDKFRYRAWKPAD